MYVCAPPSHNSAESSLIFFTTLALTHCICEAAEYIAKMCYTRKTDCLLATYLKKIFMIASCQAMFNLYNNIHEKTASSRGWVTMSTWLQEG